MPSGRGSSIALFPRRKRRLPAPEHLALSYVTGMGIIPLYLIVLYLSDKKFTPVFTYLPLCVFILAAGIYALFSGKEKIPFEERKKRFSSLEAFLACGMLFEVFRSHFRALIRPIESFDSVASFDIKAKIFFLAGGIPQDFFRNLAEQFPHPRYPLMVPLQEAFSFLSMGAFNDQIVKIIFPMHFLALLVLFYFGAKHFIGRKCALIFTFLMAGLNELNRFSATGFTDIHFSLYLTIGFIYWLRYVTGEDKRRSFILIAGLFSAFAMFTKDAGALIPFIYLLLTALYLTEKKSFKAAFSSCALYLAVFLLSISPWLFVKLNMNLEQGFITAGVFNAKYFKDMVLARTVPILYEFQANVFNPKKWNILWPVFIVLFALNYRRSLATRMKYLSVFILLLAVFYFLFYILVDPAGYGTGEAYAQSLRSGMNRHLIYTVPLVMLWLGLLFKEERFCEED